MTRRDRSSLKQLADALTSMRLTIIVLLVLALGSILSIIFLEYHPTNFYGWQEYYSSHMNPIKFKLYTAFQLFTPYHSWWFIGLLSILCVSLFLCSINRLKGVYRIITNKNDFRNSDRLSRQKNYYSFRAESNGIIYDISHLLRRKLYRVFVRNDGDKTYIYARKGTFSRFGPFLSHAGLLALFAGGLVASIAGKSTMLWGEPGQFVKADFADHRIFISDFKIIYSDKGQVKDYISTLEVFNQNNSVLESQEIEVNKPLRFRGISYYQASYRLNPRKIKMAALALSTNEGFDTDTLVLEFGKKVNVKGTDYSLELSDFSADFQITQQGKVVSKSEELRNPAILINYYRNEEKMAHEWLFAKFPSVHAGKDLPLETSLLDFEPVYYTGLQVATNPGSILIWAGFAIMTIGLLLVFYLNHKQVWVALAPAKGSEMRVYIAGTSHKFKDQFKIELKDFVQKAKTIAVEKKTKEKGTAPELAALN